MLKRVVQLIPKGRLARNAAIAGCWQAARAGTQALWVVVIARQLGPQGYGGFSGIAGLATALGGFTGLGLGLVMMQEVSRRRDDFAGYWRLALRATLGSGVLLCLLFVLLGSKYVAAGMSTIAIIGIGLSELVCVPMVTLCAYALAAHERIGWAAALPAVLACARLAAAVCFWQLDVTRTIGVYVWFHVGGTSLGAALALLTIKLVLAPAPSAVGVRIQDIREGLGFSAVWAVGNALGSLDKTLVLRLAGSTTAGLYSGAYRLTTMLALPIEALTLAAMPRLFRKGGGDQNHPRMLAHLVLGTVGYAIVAAALLWAGAGLLPILLGAGFVPAVSATRWLALFLPCYGLRMLGSNVLLSSGRKRIRVLVESAGLLAMFCFAFWWIPGYGLFGAVKMIISTEATLAALTWVAIWSTSQSRGANELDT
jgi:O-antigen/teichoic acid export membrane protein